MTGRREGKKNNRNSSRVGRVTPVRLAAVLKLPFPVNRFELFCQPGVHASTCVRDLLGPDKVLLANIPSERQEGALPAEGRRKDAPVSARQAIQMVDPRQTSGLADSRACRPV